MQFDSTSIFVYLLCLHGGRLMAWVDYFRTHDPYYTRSGLDLRIFSASPNIDVLCHGRHATSLHPSVRICSLLEILLGRIAPNLDHKFLMCWRFEPGSKL